MKSNHSFNLSLEFKNSANNYSTKDIRKEIPIINRIEEIFFGEIDNALVFMTSMSKKEQNIKINFDIEVQNLGDENA